MWSLFGCPPPRFLESETAGSGNQEVFSLDLDARLSCRLSLSERLGRAETLIGTYRAALAALLSAPADHNSRPS